LLAHDQARGLASIAELDNRVMTQTKALSCIADRCGHSVGGPSNLEEELMLLRLQTPILGRCLTEVEKQAELMAKFGEYLKSGCWFRHSFFIHHSFKYIVTRHNTLLDRTARGNSVCAFSDEHVTPRFGLVNATPDQIPYACGSNLARLQRAKKRLDPDGIFTSATAASGKPDLDGTGQLERAQLKERLGRR
jgi:hypothetical protein